MCSQLLVDSHMQCTVCEGSTYLLSQINGVNGTLVANQYVRAGPNQPANTMRTLITLDNGGNWELVNPPERYSNSTLVNCDPPACSLHLHMSNSEYFRTGVFSVVSTELGKCINCDLTGCCKL